MGDKQLVSPSCDNEAFLLSLPYNSEEEMHYMKK